MDCVLALSTSTSKLSVAIGVLHDGQSKVLANLDHVQQGSSAENIFSLIQKVQDQVGLVAPDGINAIAFDAGPGAFTGVRIGCGVAQGLGFAWNLPVVPVCSLLAISGAIGSIARKAPTLVFVAIDARMNELYFAAYWLVQGGEIVGNQASRREQYVIEPSVASATQAQLQFESLLSQYRDEQHTFDVTCLGNGFSDLGVGIGTLKAFSDRLQTQPQLTSIFGNPIGDPFGDTFAGCDASSIIIVAHKLLFGMSTATRLEQFSAASAAPLYVRNKVALDKTEQRNLRLQSLGPVL